MPKPYQRLTHTERRISTAEVIQHYCDGSSIRQIAVHLERSYGMVHRYLHQAARAGHVQIRAAHKHHRRRQP